MAQQRKITPETIAAVLLATEDSPTRDLVTLRQRSMHNVTAGFTAAHDFAPEPFSKEDELALLGFSEDQATALMSVYMRTSSRLIVEAATIGKQAQREVINLAKFATSPDLEESMAYLRQHRYDRMLTALKALHKRQPELFVVSGHASLSAGTAAQAHPSTIEPEAL